MPLYRNLLIALISFPINASGQFYFYNDDYYDAPIIVELGFSSGMMNCLTDLGGKKGIGQAFIKDLNWSDSKFCAGIYASALYNRAIGVRLELVTGQVTADDHDIKPGNSVAMNRYERNLHFKSNITECNLQIELHPLSLFSENIPSLSPYFLAGMGIFRFDPQASFKGNWIRLSQLHTEGQGFPEYPHRKPYELTQFSMPLGMGFLYELSALLHARIEIVHRVLNTDYLDDVSTRYIQPSLFHQNLDRQLAAVAEAIANRNARAPVSPGQIRGNPSNNDSYFTITLKLGFIINRKRHSR